jgi:hypothetical protein
MLPKNFDYFLRPKNEAFEPVIPKKTKKEAFSPKKRI